MAHKKKQDGAFARHPTEQEGRGTGAGGEREGEKRRGDAVCARRRDALVCINQVVITGVVEIIVRTGYKETKRKHRTKCTAGEMQIASAIACSLVCRNERLSA